MMRIFDIGIMEQIKHIKIEYESSICSTTFAGRMDLATSFEDLFAYSTLFEFCKSYAIQKVQKMIIIDPFTFRPKTVYKFRDMNNQVMFTSG